MLGLGVGVRAGLLPLACWVASALKCRKDIPHGMRPSVGSAHGVVQFVLAPVKITLRNQKNPVVVSQQESEVGFEGLLQGLHFIPRSIELRAKAGIAVAGHDLRQAIEGQQYTADPRVGLEAQVFAIDSA